VRTALRRAAPWIIAVASLFAATGIFGFLTSVAFNQSLKRESFSSDRASDWWVIGARSLVAPSVYAATALIIGRLGAAFWRALCQVVPPIRRVTAAVRAPIVAGWQRLGGSAGSSIAHWLIVVHVAALLVIWWRFYDLLNAIVFVSEVPPEVLATLAPFNIQSLLYRPALTVLIVAMVLLWHELLSRPHLAKSVGWTTRVAGAGMLLVTVLLLEVPYRLLSQNDGRRVEYGDARCYDLGHSGTEVLLYCPDSPPRIRIVGVSDFKETPVTESIFSPATPSP
jgi:hypothetical protein